MKALNEFLNESTNFESRTHKKLLDAIKATKTYMDIYDEEFTYHTDEVVLQTRENGNVGNETTGSADVKEVKRVEKILSKKFPDLKFQIEEVDEWVSLTIRPTDKAKLSAEATLKKQKAEATKLIASKLKVSSKQAVEIVESLSYAKKYYEKNKDESRIHNGFRVYSKHSNSDTKDFKNADDVFKYIKKPKFIKDLYNSANPRNKFSVYLYGWSALDLNYDEDTRPILPDGSKDWGSKGKVLSSSPFYVGNIEGEKDLLKIGKKVIADFISAYKIYVLNED